MQKRATFPQTSWGFFSFSSSSSAAAFYFCGGEEGLPFSCARAPSANDRGRLDIVICFTEAQVRTCTEGQSARRASIQPEDLDTPFSCSHVIRSRRPFLGHGFPLFPASCKATYHGKKWPTRIGYAIVHRAYIPPLGSGRWQGVQGTGVWNILPSETTGVVVVVVYASHIWRK